tara:strand:- start:5971 stop:6363 length:393 start_codon:yes stop_codon:yes gene_type:complete
MAAPSVDTFKIRFPELISAGDTVIDFWIVDVVEELCEPNFGDCYPVAVETLAAHRLALSLQRQAQAAQGITATVGAVQSASADGLSVSLAVSKAATGSGRESYLAQTPYGLEYLSIREKCLGRGRVTSCR